MELSNYINLADPNIRFAFYEAGKWSRLIAIITGIFMALAILFIAAFVLFAPEVMTDAFLDNPVFASMSPTYLIVMYSATVLMGLFVSVLLFRFGSTLKGQGPSQPLSNTEINNAFSDLLMILKYYAIFSIVNLVGSVVMLFV